MAAFLFVVVVVLGERFDGIKLYGGYVLSDEEDFAQIFRGERIFWLYPFDFLSLFFSMLFVTFVSSLAQFHDVFSPRFHHMFMLG